MTSDQFAFQSNSELQSEEEVSLSYWIEKPAENNGSDGPFFLELHPNNPPEVELYIAVCQSDDKLYLRPKDSEQTLEKYGRFKIPDKMPN